MLIFWSLLLASIFIFIEASLFGTIVLFALLFPIYFRWLVSLLFPDSMDVGPRPRMNIHSI